MENNLTDNQKIILKEFYQMQCDEDSGRFNDDETPVLRYDRLERVTGISKPRLKVEILEMRNAGILELSMAVNQDYMPSGSGYLLTDPKGTKLVRDLFFKGSEENQ